MTRARFDKLTALSQVEGKTPSSENSENIPNFAPCHFDHFGRLRVNSGRNPSFEESEKSSC
jgi:hypothetical protein